MATHIALRSTVVPSRLHPWFNTSAIVVWAAVARSANLSAEELGLARRHLGSGLRHGAAAAALVTAVIAVATIVPATSGHLEDSGVETGIGSMLLTALVVIPVATVVLEELVFRGVLLGLLQRAHTTLAAISSSAVVFGAWHIVTAWNGSHGATLSRVGAVVATVVVTAGAGVVFGWLRVRSGSLLAPIVAHVSTNSVAFAAAWVVRNR